MSQNFLKKIREEKGVKASELARLVGVSRQNIYSYEQGVGISNNVLIKIANALDVSANHILTGEESRSENAIKSEYLSKAMDMTYKFYENDDLERSVMIKIATEIYNLIANYNKVKDSAHKEIFEKSLQDKIIKGLAAKCFLEFDK